MKRYFLPVVLLCVSCAAFAQESAKDEFARFDGIKAAVARILSYPAYTRSDEKTINGAGDIAAIAIIRSISTEDLNSPAKARQVLLILSMAFAAPQLIQTKLDRRPTAAMLLLSYLSQTNYDRTHTNQIENVRREIQHNTSSGKPFQFVTLEGAPPFDAEHTQWVSNILKWTLDIKPGMTRKDLLKVYTEEGGLSTRTRRTYALKGCPYVKVDVEFMPVGQKDSWTESMDDKIVKISKPYFDHSRTD